MTKSIPRYAPSLLALGVIVVLASGCASTVSIASKKPSQGSLVKPSEVQFYPTLRGLPEPLEVRGAMSVYVLPIGANKFEAREEIIRKTAAATGAKAVVGLQPAVGKILHQAEKSICLLAGPADKNDATGEPLKLTVCLPPIDFQIKADQPAAIGVLSNYLVEAFLDYIPYIAGYYVYPCAERVTKEQLLNGTESRERLSEPLGLRPDYALCCTVEGYDAKGSKMWDHYHRLTMTLELIDLHSRQPVWRTNIDSAAGRNEVVGFLTGGIFGGVMQAGLEADELRTVRHGVYRASTKMPKAPGLKPGRVTPVHKS